MDPGATRIEADRSIKQRAEERILMRRASTCLALLGLAVFGLPAVASAAPTVTFKEKAVPIPGFPHTGNILGAGAALQTEWTIKGTEYGGFPPPLIGVNVYLPAGVKLHPQGFVTCSPTVLANTGSKACPKKSKVTTAGGANGVVSFGTTRVPEHVVVEGFFAPGGGLQFLSTGSEPAAFEIISPAHVVNSNSPSIITTVPLVETVPGAPDASVESINVTAGSAYKQGKKTIYYGTVPKTCPKGGFPVKSELIFAALGGLAQQTVTSNYKAPCPRK
jgi:hypothetical protein